MITLPSLRIEEAFPQARQVRSFIEAVRSWAAGTPRVAHVSLTWTGGDTNISVSCPFRPSCAWLGRVTQRDAMDVATGVTGFDWRPEERGMVVRAISGLTSGTRYDVIIRVEESI